MINSSRFVNLDYQQLTCLSIKFPRTRLGWHVLLPPTYEINYLNSYATSLCERNCDLIYFASQPIIMLHVDMIYLACRGQKYATIQDRALMNFFNFLYLEIFFYIFVGKMNLVQLLNKQTIYLILIIQSFSECMMFLVHVISLDSRIFNPLHARTCEYVYNNL